MHPSIAPLVGFGERIPLGCRCLGSAGVCQAGGWCGSVHANEGDGEAVLALANMESKSARLLLGVWDGMGEEVDDHGPPRRTPDTDPPPIVENNASRDEPVDYSTWSMPSAKGE